MTLPVVEHCGTILALAYRPNSGDAMIEIERASVAAGQGFDLEPGHRGKRGVTLLSKQSWDDVCRELAVSLPWHTRRANVLVDGLDLGLLVGHTLRIGDVRLLVHGETRPCGLMDQLHPGLRQALTPAFRGGVHAEVVSGGLVEAGSSILATAKG